MENLPKSSESHNQERRSKLAFDLIVPDDLFLVRNEDGGDYGADKIIELKLHGTQISNFRSYIQIKSTSLSVSNKTLTFSVPIKTLNYLINQPNSLFVVYIEKKAIFLWDWIAEIVGYSTSKGIEISSTNQKTIDFHFNKRLNRAAFMEIHNEINTKGNIIKQISDYIKISNSTTTNLYVNTNTQSVVNTEHLVENIKQHGIALANEGQFALLNEMLSRVPLKHKDDPEYSLIVAYFKYSNGEYYNALSWIPMGTKQLKLDDDLKGLSEYLEMSLKYLLKMYNSDIYNERFNHFLEKYPENPITLQHKLFLYKEELVNSDPTLKEKHQELTISFKETIEKIRQITSQDSTVFIFIELVEWELTGFQLLRELNFSRFNLEGRNQIGHPVLRPQLIEKTNEIIQKIVDWMMKFESLYKSINDEVIKARVHTTFANIQLQFISNFQIKDSLNESGDKMLPYIKESLEYNIEVLQQNGYLHELFRAQMSLAECYMGMGLNAKATDIVQNVLLNAESVGSSNIVTYCNAFLEGFYIFNIPQLAQAEKENKRQLSDLSDSDLEKYARQMAELLEIPSNRYPNVLTEYHWLRKDEIDRFQFCEHIGTEQDLKHTSSLQTIYSINPNRIIICEKFGYASPIGQNRDYLISYFKSNFCLTCEFRKPMS